MPMLPFERPEKEAEFFQEPPAVRPNDPLADISRARCIRLETASFEAASGLALPGHEDWLARELAAAAAAARKERGEDALFAYWGVFQKSWEDFAVRAPMLLAPAVIAETGGEMTLFVVEEEAAPNPALLQLLKEREGCVPEMPQGADPTLEEFLNALNRCGLAGWSYTAQMGAAVFEPDRYWQYADAKARCKEIANHPAAGALLAGGKVWKGPEKEGEAEALLTLPLHASSAQRRAVWAASEGLTAALTGSSGTGKTQTAVNAAFHFLAEGKSVLYLARSGKLREKAEEALRAGAGEAVLALPAYDAASRIRARLAGRQAAGGEREEAAASARQLNAARAQAEELLKATHRLHSCGLRYYEAVEGLAAHLDAPEGIAFTKEEVAPLHRDTLLHWRGLCAALEQAGRAVGHPVGHALREVGLKACSRRTEEEAQEILEGAAALAGAADERAQTLAVLWNFPRPARREEYEQLYEMSSALSVWAELPQEWLGAPDLNAFVELVAELIEKSRQAAKSRAKLLNTFAEPALAADAETFLAQWNEADGRLMARASVQGKIFKELGLMARHGVKLERRQVPSLLQAIIDYQAEQRAIKAMLPEVGPMLGTFWKDVYTDYTAVESMCERARAADGALRAVLGSREAVGALYRKVHETQSIPLAAEFCRAWKAFAAARDDLFELLKIEQEDWFEPGESYLHGMAAAFARWKDAAGGLRAWAEYQGARAQAASAGLSAVVAAYEGGMAHGDLCPAFEKALSLALCRMMEEEDPLLAVMDHALCEERVKAMTEAEERARTAAARAVRAALSQRAAIRLEDAPPYSEEGMLRRSLEEGAASLKRLFERIPSLMLRLFPCVVASPASAARFPAGYGEKFDLVILDDAARVGLEEGAALLSRGRAALVIDRGGAKEGEQSVLAALLEAGGREIALEWNYADEALRSPEAAFVKSASQTKSAVAARIAEGLGRRGWRTRFDGGGVDALICGGEEATRPLLGILLDGGQMEPGTLFDRECSRAAAAREGGWALERVWCAGWRKQPEECYARLEQELNRAELERRRSRAAAQKPPVQETGGGFGFAFPTAAPGRTPTEALEERKEAPAKVPEQAKERGGEPQERPAAQAAPAGAALPAIGQEEERGAFAGGLTFGFAEDADGALPEEGPPESGGEEDAPARPRPRPAPAQRPAVAAGCPWEEQPYRPSYLPVDQMPPARVLDEASMPLLRVKAVQVVEQEAPVAEPLLVKRVLASCGIRRAGARLTEAVVRAVRESGIQATGTQERRVYWRKGDDPAAYTLYRSAQEGVARRDGKEIPTVECANAACAALWGGGSLTALQLARQAAYLMGYQRLGATLENWILDGVEEAWQRGDLESEDGERFRLAPQKRQ